MLGTAAFNTVARTVIGTFLTTVVSFATAYVLSKRNLPFNRFLTISVIIPMFFGGGLIPFYLQMKKMGLVNNFLLYILPSIVSGYYIMVMRTLPVFHPWGCGRIGLDRRRKRSEDFVLYLPADVITDHRNDCALVCRQPLERMVYRLYLHDGSEADCIVGYAQTCADGGSNDRFVQ